MGRCQNQVSVERLRHFGEIFLALLLCNRLGFAGFCKEYLPDGREDIPWHVMVCILVLARFCAPSSELQIAESWYDKTALDDILGVPPEKINDDRLYRALDALLPHKDKLCRTRTPKSMLKKFEQELLSQDWEEFHAGVEVRLCPSHEDTKGETFVLCRSQGRKEKENAILNRFVGKMETSLAKMAARSRGSRRRQLSFTNQLDRGRSQDIVADLHRADGSGRCFPHCQTRSGNETHISSEEG
jgi:hypothetical protein